MPYKKWVPKIIEQEVPNKDCAMDMTGIIMHEKLYYQNDEGEEGYFDRCDILESILVYTVRDGKISISGCKGCEFFRGKES